MAKMHYKTSGNDCRKQGQTEHEYTHQAACGYVRDNVTTNGDEVDCHWCLQSIHMVSHHATNNTVAVAQPNDLGEGRERGILREASSGEAATSTDGLDGETTERT